jgi:hypothetical protein
MPNLPLQVPLGPNAIQTAAVDPAGDPLNPAQSPQQEYFTLDELKGEMKKLAWTKGDFTITPYGTLWANMTWETSRSANGDYVLYVLRPKDNDNESFDVDAKPTRLGFDVLGPHVCFFGDAQTGGKVEIDFQGSFSTENKGALLLRHAYVEVKNDEYRLLAGQTWDVISPLYPGVLFYTVGWDGGNIGYRRAQARAERYIGLSDNLLITAQASVNEDLLSDSGITSDHSGWPVLEGRLAATVGPRGPGRHPIEMGVSSHVGDTILFLPAATSTGVSRRTWSLTADIRVPITSRFGVQGELWTGENLATFFGGIGQGINLAAPYNTIRSHGGWVDVWYDWTERWHSHVGYSIDDPVDSDITYTSATVGRVYNSFIFANLSFDVTKKFLVGFEYTSWRTLWKGPNVDAPDQHFDFVAKYGF